MTQQTINIGAVANDGTGDPLRTAFNKANGNFTEVYDITQGAFDAANNSASIANSAFDAANNAAIGILWTITANGSSAFVFDGPGIESDNTNNPELYLYKGFTYTFVSAAGGSHPFAIRESNGGAAYTRGVSGSQTGTQIFTVPMDAPSTLYYQCTNHSGMGNVINIVF